MSLIVAQVFSFLAWAVPGMAHDKATETAKRGRAWRLMERSSSLVPRKKGGTAAMPVQETRS